MPVLDLRTKLSSEAEISENGGRSLIFIAALLLFFFLFFTSFFSSPPPFCYIWPVGNVTSFANRRDCGGMKKRRGMSSSMIVVFLGYNNATFFSLGPSDGE